MAKIEIEIKTLRIVIFVTQPPPVGKPFLRSVAAFWQPELEPVPVKALAHASCALKPDFNALTGPRKRSFWERAALSRRGGVGSSLEFCYVHAA
jgi:hypothetical protein